MNFNLKNYPVTITLIVINVAVFAVLEILGLIQGYGLYNAGVLTLGSLAEGRYYTLVTSMFMHGGLIHILCNMVTLYYVGTIVEDVFGPVRYLVVYFVAGLAGGATSMAVAALTGTNIGVVGASGAIFGLFGAYGYLLIREHRAPVVLMAATSKADLQGFFSFLAINVIIGLSPGIAMEAHIGGMVAGLIVAIPFYELLRASISREIAAGRMRASYVPPKKPAYDFEAAQRAQDAAMAAQANYDAAYDAAKPLQREEMERQARDMEKR